MKRTLATNLLVLAVSLATASAAAEVLLRVLRGPPVTFRFPQEHYEPDPEIGHRLVSRQSAFTHDKSVETNAYGLRDRDYPPRRLPETQRLLALGDSETFGNGLMLEDTWPKQLESQLVRDDPRWKWEVINGGLPGTDTWQHERILARLFRSYDIDAVLLAFYVNDVATTPQRVASDSGSTNTTSRRIAYLLKRSALVTTLLQARLIFPSWRASADRERHVLTGEPDPLVERSWSDVERALGEMKAMADTRSVGLLIAVLPRRDQVDGRTPATAYNARIAEITRRLEIPTVDVLEALRRAWPKHGAALFIPWDGHNSAIANEIVARELVSAVRVLAPSPADPVAER